MASVRRENRAVCQWLKLKVETIKAQFLVDGNVTIPGDTVEGQALADIFHEPASDSGAIDGAVEQ